ncbi:MAG: hypothetical protein IH600_14995 [Bacteroidetes bacterium]|nr:hypothetical protein [Bacteroidota bacterium]
MNERSDTYINHCIVCGRVTIGRELKILPDGPPLGVCGEHQQMLDDDPGCYIVYCIACRQAAYVLHTDGYANDRLLFTRDCPHCNPNTSKIIQAQTWDALNSTKTRPSGSSSTPPPTDRPSTSTGTRPDG